MNTQTGFALEKFDRDMGAFWARKAQKAFALACARRAEGDHEAAARYQRRGESADRAARALNGEA